MRVSGSRAKWFPLDVFLISGHMHMGAGASMSLMGSLAGQPAVRSYGMVTYHRFENYDVQAMEYIRAGRINTMFIDPGNTADEGEHFDAAPYIAKIREEYPNIVFVLYTWPEYLKRFTEINPRFRHFLYLYHPDTPPRRAKENWWNDDLNRILEQCEEWHTTRFEYDVALSFAGEDREFAEDLAARLKSEGIRVFYDKYERAKLFGKDLYTLLADIYSNRCRFCVLLSSRHYAEKMWTSHERRSAQERALRERGNEFILPVRIDDTKIPGLSDITGHVRATEGAEKVAELVIQKLWITDPNQAKEYIGSSLY